MNNVPINFFVPIDLQKASTEDKANGILCRIHGVASTPAQDEDGEFLDPAGFDLSYFLNQGYFNYNHNHKDPEAVVGEPTNAFVKGTELHVEGVLYDKPKSRKIVELAEQMQKAGSKRKIGFSIEGLAKYRDPNQRNRVLKAQITGCAITPTPKNPGTWMDILKGNFSNLPAPQDDKPPTEKSIGRIFTINNQFDNMTKEALAGALSIILQTGVESLLEKGMDGGDGASDDSAQAESPLEKKTGKMPMKKRMTTPPPVDDDEGEEGDDEEEMDDDPKMEKANLVIAQSLQKAMVAIGNRLTNIEQGLQMALENTAVNNELVEDLSNGLEKGFGSNDSSEGVSELREYIESLEEKIDEIAKSMSNFSTGRKSLPVLPTVDRQFNQDGEPLQKGFNNGKPTKSMSRDRAELSNVLMAKAQTATDNNLMKGLSDAIISLEMGQGLSPLAKAHLSTDYNIVP